MVYVDDISVWPTKIRCFKHGSCHLLADTEDELHEFAAKLGMKREWFQNHRYPHYDLTPLKRRTAVSLGAKELSLRELMAFMKRYEKKNNGKV